MTTILRLVLSRVIQTAAAAFVLASLAFVAIEALPGDTALRIAAARLGEDRVTTASADRVRRDAGLDAPLAVRWLDWSTRMTSGDFGRSLVTDRPVVEEVRRHLGATVGLGALAWAISLAAALIVGGIAGRRPGGAFDRGARVVTIGLAALPTHLAGVLLVAVFALHLHWLPAAGSTGAAHAVLPVATLAIWLFAASMPVVRNAVADVGRAFHLTFARLKGLPPAAAFRAHGVRNASVPVVVFAAVQFAQVVDGFVVVESLFAWPGIGDLMIKSLVARDIPVVAACGLVVAVAYAGLNLLADVAALMLDPRRTEVTR